jgi:hypothetical protein
VDDRAVLLGLTEFAILHVERMVYGKELGTITMEVPLDWWEHFKERWFPVWALRRWPVRYHRHTSTGWHLYPKIDVGQHKPYLYIDSWKSQGESHG